MSSGKKHIRRSRKAASTPKRRTAVEVLCLETKGDARAKAELREFAQNTKRTTERAIQEFDRVREMLGALTVGEIKKMIDKKRPVGAPRKSKTLEYIDKLAQFELQNRHYRPLASLFRPDLSRSEAYNRLRTFRNKYRKEILARVAELKLSNVTA